MTEIIGIRFKSGGKQYYFDPQGLEIQAGQGVIIETSRGIEYAECIQGNAQVEDDAVVQPLRPVIRVATDKDLENVRRNKEKESRAFQICQEKIADHGLDMKLVEVEYNFEGNKILFFFTSEGRVDFRALVKDLAGIFHTRIELRQIGVRDEAKMLGGLGICGKPFCCSSFLEEFQPVSIKMAKTQNLSLNPTKISGTCGRLMCCLKYEQDAYEDAVKRLPKSESFVETPDGVGSVTQVNLLRETVKVRLDDQPENCQCYHNCEICVVRNGKGKRPDGYVAPPPQELEKLRKITPPPQSDEEKLANRLGTTLNNLGGTPAAAPAPQEDRRGNRNRSRPTPKNQGGEVRQEPQPQERKQDAPRPQRPPRPQQQQEQRSRPPRQQNQPNNKPPQQQAAPIQQVPAPAPQDDPLLTGERKPNRNRRRYRGKPRSEGGGPKQPPKEG